MIFSDFLWFLMVFGWFLWFLTFFCEKSENFAVAYGISLALTFFTMNRVGSDFFKVVQIVMTGTMGPVST